MTNYNAGDKVIVTTVWSCGTPRLRKGLTVLREVPGTSDFWLRIDDTGREFTAPRSTMSLA